MNATKSQTDSKGYQTEELLRNYFLKAGYFVVRGAPFTYSGFAVTDVDLWLYNRVSPVSREISIVDIKSKRTPQAIERIFWTKGLQAALGVSRAMVATTENRPEVRKFGKDLDVLVLDGRFLRRLSEASPSLKSRITDEELRGLLVEANVAKKIDGDWMGRILESKGKLLAGLSFDNINYWLSQAHFFVEQVLSRETRRELGLRCFYLTASFTSLAVDYILRDLSFLDEGDREKVLRDGFIYGERGQSGTRSVIDTSVSLIEQFTDRGLSIGSEIRRRINDEIERVPANILSQFFARNDTARVLFDTSREMESFAMARAFQSHAGASTNMRSIIGCLLDFWGVDRKAFAGESSQLSLESLSPIEPTSEAVESAKSGI